MQDVVAVMREKGLLSEGNPRSKSDSNETNNLHTYESLNQMTAKQVSAAYADTVARYAESLKEFGYTDKQVQGYLTEAMKIKNIENQKSSIVRLQEEMGVEGDALSENKALRGDEKDLNETVLKTETVADEENTSGNSDLQVFKKNNKMETQESYLRSDADPIRLTLGRASDSHPAELNNIRVHCDDIGVEIKERAGTMAYSPNPSPGKPGTLIIDQDASISAWRHEYQHVLDDYAMGWGGFRIFENRDACWKMEENAYNIELKLAQELDDSNAIEILQKYKDMRKKEIYGEE